MVGEVTVVGVVDNAVNGVALKEAGLLTRYEVGNRVGIVLRYVVSVVRVKRDKTVCVDLRIGRLGNDYPVVVTIKSTGCVTRPSLSVKGHEELKRSVGNVNNRFGECRIKLQLYEGAIAQLYSELVTELVFTVEMLVDSRFRQ